MPDKLDTIEMILKKFIREQGQHNGRVNEFMIQQETQNTKVIEEIDSVKRGVYGDPQNQNPGLLDRQKVTEETVRRIKSKQSKTFWWASGAVAGLNVAIYFVKELFTHK